MHFMPVRAKMQRAMLRITRGRTPSSTPASLRSETPRSSHTPYSHPFRHCRTLLVIAGPDRATQRAFPPRPDPCCPFRVICCKSIISKNIPGQKLPGIILYNPEHQRFKKNAHRPARSSPCVISGLTGNLSASAPPFPPRPARRSHIPRWPPGPATGALRSSPPKLEAQPLPVTAELRNARRWCLYA